jgi:hypothetical protein
MARNAGGGGVGRGYITVAGLLSLLLLRESEPVGVVRPWHVDGTEVVTDAAGG